MPLSAMALSAMALACRVAPPIVNASRGVPVTVTVWSKSTWTVTVEPLV